VKKIILFSMMGIIIAMFVFGTSPAYAILGVRAARTALAARKASQMTSSSSATPEEAYAQEKARFEKPVRTGQVTNGSTSNTLKGKESL
jgi:hypothetical protein